MLLFCTRLRDHADVRVYPNIGMSAVTEEEITFIGRADNRPRLASVIPERSPSNPRALWGLIPGNPRQLRGSIPEPPGIPWGSCSLSPLDLGITKKSVLLRTQSVAHYPAARRLGSESGPSRCARDRTSALRKLTVRPVF